MCNFAPSKRRVIFYMELNSTDWSQYLSHPVFSLISDVADEMGRECFVIGGFVRDIMLNRPSKDIDVVSLGSGIEIAEALCRKIGRKAHLAVFRSRVCGSPTRIILARLAQTCRRRRLPARRPESPRFHHQCHGYMPQQSTLRYACRPL